MPSMLGCDYLFLFEVRVRVAEKLVELETVKQLYTT